MTRSADLDEKAIGWLENDSAVGSLLGSDGAVEPAAVAKEAVAESDPLLAVGSRQLLGARTNTGEDKRFAVRVAVAGSQTYVETNGAHELKQLLNAATDVLTEKRTGWHPREESVINEEQIRWNGTLNRYVGAVECGLERSDEHAYYK